MLVPSSRLLVPIYDLDPVIAAPLTDAALTPYASIKNSLPKLMGDEYVVVIGVGGLGHVAVQILSAVCSSTIIACDIKNLSLQKNMVLNIPLIAKTLKLRLIFLKLQEVKKPKLSSILLESNRL